MVFVEKTAIKRNRLLSDGIYKKSLATHYGGFFTCVAGKNSSQGTIVFIKRE